MTVPAWPSGDGEMARLIREFDWASTPLGPVSHWPQSLKTVADLMLASRGMMSLLWGPEAIHLYNDSFMELLREHRILALGRSAHETFARSRSVFEAEIAAGMAGRSARLVAQRYPVLRHGRLEDAWFDVDYVPIRDEAGAVAGVLWTLKETTARHLAEQALRASRMCHRLLVGSWTQAEWETDAKGVVTTDSPSWRAYTGQTLQEWLGYGWLDAIHPEDRAYAERQWRETTATRGLVNVEFRLRAPDGIWRWSNVRAAPVLDERGDVEGWAGININIDDRRNAETALRESEALRRIALEGGRMGTWRWDLRSRMIRGDPQFLAMWGFPASDESHPLQLFSERMSPEGAAEMEALVTRAVEAGEEFDGQLEIVSGPTAGRWIRWRGRADGDALSILHGVSFDVTGQKLAEAALRGSEARYRALATAGSYLVYRMSPDWGQMHQLDGRGVLADTSGPAEDWSDTYILPEDRPTVFAAIAEAIRGRSLFELEHRVRRADGSVGWVLSRAVPMLGPEGGIKEWFGAATDVTERRTAQERLRESETALAADLAGTTLLRDFAERLVTEENVEAIHEEILSAAMLLTQADAGTVQIFDPGTKSLVLLATRNFARRMTDRFHRVDAGSSTACGMALRSGRRTFADFDEADPDEACRLHVEAGYRSAQTTPLLSRSGRPLGMLSTHWRAAGHRPNERELRFLDLLARQAADLIEQREAQRVLRASEARFRGFADASADVLWIADARGERLDYLSPAFEQVFGAPRQAALADLSLVLGLVHPKDRAVFLSGMPRSLAGETAIVHYRVVHPGDGRVVYLRDTGFPIRDERGAIVQVAGVVQDISDIEATRVALEAEKERFRTLAEGIPQLVWRSCAEGRWTWASPQWLDYTGQSQQETHGLGWLDVVHPDDHEATRRAWHDALPDGRLGVEFRVRRASDGAWRWHQTRSVPVRDAPGPDGMEGAILEWLGTTTDIEGLKRLQGQQQVLVAELQHRTRNLLAVVRNVARRSIDASPGRDQYDARLSALGRVQGFLSRSTAYAVPLADIVEAELLAAGDGTSDRVTVEGPVVMLPGESVQAVALALHELATNAVKYGAIAQPSGRLSVTWRLDAGSDGRRLVIEWHESGVTMPEGSPVRRGYGSELITRALPYQLGADTTLEFMPDGVKCRVALPDSAFSMSWEDGPP